MALRDALRQKPAQRPAAYERAHGNRRGDLVGSLVERSHGMACRMAMAGQVDGVHSKARGELRQRFGPYAGMQAPAVEQREVGTVAMALHVQRHGARLSTSARASPSTSTRVCAAQSDMRRREVPSGTEGGRMAGTQ